MHRLRNNYWSCSKFADFLRKAFNAAPKPVSATAEQWDEWTSSFKSKKRFVYWLTEKFLNDLQDVIMFIPDLWNTFRIYVRYRWILKTHCVNTTLEKGEWHEYDQRMLFANFQLLVDFVETEKPIFSSKKQKRRFWNVRLPRFLNFGIRRSRELGEQYLEWEIGLKYDEESWGITKNDQSYGKPTPQALAACEILNLYTWWCDVRPYRPDPDDLARKLLNFDKEEHLNDQDFWKMLSKPLSLKKQQLYDLINEIEQAQYQEDQEMLIRLISVRKYLWM